MTVTLHIGLPKTGTTTLQRRLFAEHPGIASIARPFDGEDDRAVLDLIWRDRDGAQSVDDAVDCIQEKVEAARRRSQAIVLSEESIAVHPTPRLPDVADSLRRALGEARILLVLREPLDLVESNYLQWLRGVPERRAYRPPDEWLSHAWNRMEDGDKSRLHSLRFQEILEPFEASFGEDAVHVLVFEDLVEDETSFIERVCQIVGADSALGRRAMQGNADKQRITDYEVESKRLASVFPVKQVIDYAPDSVKRIGRHLFGSGGSGSVEFTDECRRRIEEFARPHARYVAENYDVRLGCHGYPVDVHPSEGEMGDR